jgi:ribosome-binding protein aMBF1 (putative translation factor)
MPSKTCEICGKKKDDVRPTYNINVGCMVDTCNACYRAYPDEFDEEEAAREWEHDNATDNR